MCNPLLRIKDLGPDTLPIAQDRQADVFSKVYVFDAVGEKGRINAVVPIMIITMEIN